MQLPQRPGDWLPRAIFRSLDGHPVRPRDCAVSVKATDYRWDHGVSYLIEQGYCWDGVRGWHHDDRVTDATRYGHDGHCYRWDDTECGWKFDRTYRYHWNRYEHDGQDWNHHNRNHNDH
ncbi:hypothetical protein [Streptomyces sp. NBC_01594]